jgi:hypothetical protein
MFKDLFKTKEQRALEAQQAKDLLEQQIRDEIERERLANEAKEAQRLADEAQIRLNAEAQILQAKLDSKTPWWEAIPGKEDAIYIHERYRWNQALIKEALKQGCKGDSDNEVFQSYLDKLAEDERQAVLIADREAKRKSSEPWVDITSERHHEDGRFEIEMDWNDAFIKMLRQHGFRGANEEVLVQQWLASIHKEVEQGGEYQ